jgi:hypothetical protein
MRDSCRAHRLYVSAFADGEIDLVPEHSREHLQECPDCAEEMAAHGLIGEKLRLAFGGEPAGVERRRRRLRPPLRWSRAAALLAAAVAIAGASTMGWLLTHRTVDPVRLAVEAARQAPALQTSDATVIARWCAQQSERPQPVVQLPSLTPVGARMDREDGANVVTIFYTAGSGQHLAVTWIDGAVARPDDLHVQSRNVDGSTVLVMRTHDGSAVITGDASTTLLWRTAGAVEAQSEASGA